VTDRKTADEVLIVKPSFPEILKKKKKQIKGWGKHENRKNENTENCRK